MVENVKKFNKIAEKYDCDVIMRNKDRAFVIDGKSLMGIFSLDLSKNVIVAINDENLAKEFQLDIKKFIVEE